MGSVSETSSTGFGFHGPAVAGTAAQARNRGENTEQLAALLGSQPVRVLLQSHSVTSQSLQQMEDPAAKAQRQTAQLAALLSTESGKALMQLHLGDLIKRRQQQQHAAVASPVTPNSCTTACHSYAAPLEQVDETTCSLADLHPRVLSTAIAVSRTAPGSADRAAGLALLKQEILSYTPVSSSPAQTAAGLGAASVSTAAQFINVCSPEQFLRKQQQSEQDEGKTSQSPSASSLAADGEPLTCAMAWSMLQHQKQENAAAGAALMRNDTLQSMQSGFSMRRDSSMDTGALTQGGRSSGQQLVFKRRANNSTALRRHFSNANKTTRGDASGFSKPQQLFKKQRKKPLMLWSASSNAAQQMQGMKQQQQLLAGPAGQQQQTATIYSQVTEPEYSIVTCSSSGTSGPGTQTYTEACPQGSGRTADAAFAATASAPAGLCAQASGVENVLSTLARQEQQLLLLQQQLRQQRELMSVRGQLMPEQPAVTALELELLLSNQTTPAAPAAVAPALPMAPAAADAEMGEACYLPPAVPEHQQQQQQTPKAPEVTPEAMVTLLSLAKALTATAKQQQQPQPVVRPATPSQNWDADVLRKLTAALMAA